MRVKSIYFLWGVCALYGFTAPFSYGMNRKEGYREPVEVEIDGDGYYETDTWMGPGFYYGVWFDDEGEYWGWRDRNRHYPSNRRYYHPDRPVYYRGNKANRDHR